MMLLSIAIFRVMWDSFSRVSLHLAALGVGFIPSLELGSC